MAFKPFDVVAKATVSGQETRSVASFSSTHSGLKSSLSTFIMKASMDSSKTLDPTADLAVAPSMMELQGFSSGAFTDPRTDTTTYGKLTKTRKRAIIVTRPNYSQYIDRYETTVTSDTNIASRVIGDRSGFRTPGFHSLVRNGDLLPMNPFARKVVTTSGIMQRYNYVQYNNGQLIDQLDHIGWRGSLSGFIPTGSGAEPTALEWATLDQQATTALRLRLKDMKVNVAMVIAERNKTAQTIANAARTIAESVIRLKKGDFSGAAGRMGAHVGARRRKSHARAHTLDPNQAFAKAWLELSYAWKPLLMDVVGAAEALAKARFQPIRGRVSVKKTLNINKVVPSGTPGSSFYRVEHTYGSVSVKYVVMYEISAPDMPDFTGLGLTNPALLAWELVPFSFVVDWFLPIGDWLSSLDATVGLTFTKGAKATKRDIYQKKTEIRKTRSSPSSTYTMTDEELVATWQENSVRRTVLDAFPTTHFPPFRNPVSLRNMANALALLKAVTSSASPVR